MAIKCFSGQLGWTPVPAEAASESQFSALSYSSFLTELESQLFQSLPPLSVSLYLCLCRSLCLSPALSPSLSLSLSISFSLSVLHLLLVLIEPGCDSAQEVSDALCDDLTTC